MSDSFDSLLARTERRNTPGKDPCPDADLLAAYLDATVSPAERVSIETHAADCARCALVIATVVRLEDESGHPRRAPEWSWWPRLTWMVPAAAAALGAALYVATPGPVLHPASSPAATTAPGAAAEPSLSRAAPAPMARTENLPSSAAAENAEPVLGFALRRQSPPRPAKAATAPAPQLQVSGADDLELRLDKTSAGERAVPVADRPPAAAAMDSTVRRESAAVNETGATAGAPLMLIQSPDARVAWRITASGVERSGDGGGSWVREHGPLSGRVIAAAPSAAVCWLATSAGQVLRRDVDGAWADVSPAPSLAIDRIESNGPLDATVVAPDGTRATTVDGGQTWNRESH